MFGDKIVKGYNFNFAADTFMALRQFNVVQFVCVCVSILRFCGMNGSLKYNLSVFCFIKNYIIIAWGRIFEAGSKMSEPI